MWDQPHFIYATQDVDCTSLMDELEAWVPGCLVYAYRYNKRVRFSKLPIDERHDLNGFTIMVPIHGAWLVEGYLYHANITFEVESRFVQGIGCWSDERDSREGLEHAGRHLVEQSVERGEIRPHVLKMATPYQMMGVAWAQTRPWVMNVWSCGSGKTLGTILSSTARRGPIAVICPAKARHVWWSQVQEYTTIKPYRFKPSSEMRKKDQTFDEYMEECYESRKRPFVIMGAESLVDNLNSLRELNPSVLILDEIHTHGSRKRWVAIQEADGTVSFEKRKTAASGRANSKVDRENRAVAIMEASRLPGLHLRIGLTATPLDDGRPRRLWSQLDLLCPGSFAFSYRKFADRYCDARPGQFGGLDDGGASNLTELRARCSFFTHEVPYSESHDALPSTRVQVDYLGNAELNRSTRWSDEQTFGQAFKSMVKEVKINPLAKERMVEARLAEACSRKRNYVISEILEGLKGGGKVVVFTARRRETELWAHQLRKALKKGDEALGEIPVWMGHGGVGESDRDNMVDSFRESDGPCCLIGTGQAFGTGVDGMQTADLAIFAMLPWKPGDFVQWKGRFDRLGGRATLLKVVVATSTYDERVVEILVDKFGPIEQFLRADELSGLDQKLLGLEDTKAIVDSIIGKLGAA